PRRRGSRQAGPAQGLVQLPAGPRARHLEAHQRLAHHPAAAHPYPGACWRWRWRRPVWPGARAGTETAAGVRTAGPVAASGTPGVRERKV
ncbi:hypothetical protein KEM52_000188, partial [Ascosphaera acerosa]